MRWLAVMLAALGLVVLMAPTVRRGAAILALWSVAGAFAAAIGAAVLTGIPVVVGLAAALGAGLPILWRRRRVDARRAAVVAAWPEALDSIRSGVRAGMTLPDAVAACAEQGPLPLRDRFAVVRASLSVGGSFRDAVQELQTPGDEVATRVVAMMSLADTIGSADTGRVLEALAAFLRADLAQQREIAARHSWNVAAARLAVAAPWLTVAALSVQPEARAAYTTTAGSVLLLIVGALCVLAYWLMARAGRTAGAVA